MYVYIDKSSIMNKILPILVVSFIIGFGSVKAEGDINSTKKSMNPSKSLAADCAPANGLEYLRFNNVSALIETGGRMWQDRPNTTAAYEIPINSGQTSIYAGSLWMGGTDANGQLKIAAATFGGGGNDFWTGPLTTDDLAEISPDQCTEYDRFFHITRREVELFIAWWNCKESNEGCDLLPEGYKIPKVILDWPAHGDEALNQDFYLAPFFDRNGDGVYDPENSGDYPYYDLKGDIDCRAVRDIRLFGDDTYWWVFNDKGNIHTETGGSSIGMEIRAQAFAFASNDEVNDMTFYNYELINRSTFILKDTYFGQWVDPDLGGAYDDYVGCDVMRGLGFCYNGDDFDEDSRGQLGYGNRPPAVGVDFFEGPYQDNDEINNLYGIGKDEALNGLGYLNPNDPNPDSIIDNERFGMRRFVYYDNTDNSNGNPTTALQHYNYLRGIWRNGAKMVFGGNGLPGSAGATNLEADFMFPGNSDPLHWGTKGVDPGFEWTEGQAGNPPYDRRFLQSAGPFVLEPGAVNDITVGVVWARAISGNAEASVKKLLQADSKAQALFDNCFDVLDGPDAPNISGVELDRELILYLTNTKGLSNNFKNYPGDYVEIDPFIIAPEGEVYDNKYRFQGYQIFQVSGPDVSINDLNNLDKARIAFQCDIQDSVSDLINYLFDDDLGATVPEEQVKDAANKGISTTFRATEDLFAEGDPRLVNFKTYYYIAIAYATNNFKKYTEDAEGFDGQKMPYLASRQGLSGGIKPLALIPHKVNPTNGGTIINSQYGNQPKIQRIEGQGNGGFDLAFTPKTLEKLLSHSFSPTEVFPVYKPGRGPVGIKVVNPTNVTNGVYTLKVYEEEDDLHWKIWRRGDGSSALNDTVFSQTSLGIENEQIIDKWGISVNFKDVADPGELLPYNLGIDPTYKNGYISATMTYADSSKTWLTGVSDISGANDQNWIRSGLANEPGAPESMYNSVFTTVITPDFVDTLSVPLDGFKTYESLLKGTWAPFKLVAYTRTFGTTTVLNAPAPLFSNGLSTRRAYLEDLQSIDVVITSNKDLWTRCPVIEMQEDKSLAVNGKNTSIETLKGLLRQSPSVDKNGEPDGDGVGMGWFPGYAINLETGERLNMAFGEDSWLGDQNGADMIWNPTSLFEGGFIPNDPFRRRQKKWGGKHYIYVFGNSAYMKNSAFNMPSYDQGEALRKVLSAKIRTDPMQVPRDESNAALAWSTCLWVGIPLLEPNKELLSSDVTISLRVDKKYEPYTSDTIANGGNPMYIWDMSGLSTETGVNNVAVEALDMIHVVPNPYYAFSEHYEQVQLDNIVKIINLPEQCTVGIYNISGTLVRSFNKSDPGTELEWDLKNQSSVPISSGVYLIHVNAPGVGEKIVKWFGVLRPIDLQGF